ncbi:GntR family transcriptional regulator [Fusobacterium sp.]|uniref:GntR family transcriptional regulator n=1 Tax=Fusobacterium sp. TaxID=68766 RepID=UPI00396C84B5
MEDLKLWIEGQKKVPKCVAIYDKLFKMINEGHFDEEGKLPSEPNLAKIMGVSRMTLRQAISLLIEDGIIKNMQGKGNFLIKDAKPVKKGLENLHHPVHSSLSDDVDDVELEFKIVPPSDYTNKVLGSKPVAVVFVDRWYKTMGKIAAYTLSMVPIETITENSIDLSDKSRLLEFLEKKIYQKPNQSRIRLYFSQAGNFVSSKYPLSKEKKSFLLEETVYISKEKIIVHNKHYVPVENSQIIIERK